MSSKSKRTFDQVEFTTKGKTINHLKSLSAKCRKLAKQIDRSTERSEKSVTMINFINATADFLDMGAAGMSGHISILALGVRNMFELNIRLRHVLRSEDQLKRWHGEAIIDKIGFLEGFLKLQTVTENNDAKQVLNSEIARLLALQSKYQLPSKGSPPAKNLATGVGLLDEYDTFFKMFSKLVHPTSFLINDTKTADTNEIRSILTLQLQLYAGDTFHRIWEELGFAEAITKSGDSRRDH